MSIIKRIDICHEKYYMSISNKDLSTDVKYLSSKDDSEGRLLKYLAKNYTQLGIEVSSFQLGGYNLQNEVVVLENFWRKIIHSWEKQ